MKQPFYLIGLGGIGMSALAHILLDQIYAVYGHDDKHIADDLVSKGVVVTKEIPRHAIVVYSSAIKSSHPLRIQAEKIGAAVIHRSDLCKELLKDSSGLLVTGTHGKTLTSALLTWVLISSGLDPSYAVGGFLKNTHLNGASGKGPHFVLEADESDGSFLNYHGTGAIITNIESEHLDFWKTEEALIKGFSAFISGVSDHNLLFWCGDDPLLQKMSPPGVSYGRNGNLRLISYNQKGDYSEFSVSYKGKEYHNIECPLIGEPLILNVVAVFGMALNIGIKEKDIRYALQSFKGVRRRQDKLGEIDRIAIYDDYAHHPTEVKVLLKSLKDRIGSRRLIAVFQPHKYSRIHTLLNEFASAFDHADLAIITDVYAAGETPIEGVNSHRLIDHIQGTHALFMAKNALMTYIPKLLIPGDVLVTIGAGDITTLGPQLLEKLQ